MDYSQINTFLDKFKKTLFKKEDLYKTIVDIVYKNTNILIEQKNIKIKGSTVNIKTSPIIKSEILIKKELILEDLKKEINDYKISNLN